MTTRYINVTLGTKSKADNVYSTTVSHGSTVSSHFTIAYDDTQITSQDALIQATRAALSQALGNATLTR